MRILRAVVPHPLLSLVLILLWLLLNNSASAGHLLLGAVLAVFIPFYTRRYWTEPTIVHRPGLALRFTGLVLWDILVANFRVAWLVVGPRELIRPMFVRVPLDLEGEVAVTVLTSVISLTPGTVSADLDSDNRYVLVHALSEEDPDDMIREIKTRYEAPIREIFAC
jgi:multicomponent K+:H+ antiporter subunit E